LPSLHSTKSLVRCCAVDRLAPPQRDAVKVAFGLLAAPPPDRFLVALAVLNLLSDATSEQPIVCLPIGKGLRLGSSRASGFQSPIDNVGAHSLLIALPGQVAGVLEQLLLLLDDRPDLRDRGPVVVRVAPLVFVGVQDVPFADVYAVFRGEHGEGEALVAADGAQVGRVP
jgi:hypothetical protein